MAEERIHGTCVDIEGRAVLMVGPPGSGKSDLALRLIDAGARLVADDYTDLRLEDGRVVASAPAAIAGRMEVRGIGVVEVETAAQSPLTLVVELVAGGEIERLPEDGSRAYLGRQFPLYRIAPFEASAASKVRLALRLAGRGDIAGPA